ncbi:MAG: FAD-binding oxidoreductase [Alphaproteobacteria bacterium]|jgi:sarcosine oxidase, subunit beta|nr:FAD-binding oxidoreductase [Rhodospirillaceae bacterium]MDG2480233.1 FAD-binding oxidoreductase [Alphaproteobacteria bacterium]MBT6204033.1 FAD-binding oxidoreductase [Rhodospirillaceae bacterium]MBT6511615.1 FAD-binding oxidoreductase [Rhodospirillaceae bacterium]MBT7611915.1 FAD-binding oxidoreductase [Rhodospirillaceae bacterium]
MTRNLIVGGGVYGAAVAFELASRGEEVRLIEADCIRAGASAGPGSRGVRANYRDYRELPLMAMARTLWPGLHETLDVPALFERTGQLILLERSMDFGNAEARVALQNRHGIPTELLGQDALREREPDLTPAILGAVWCPDDGVADHSATTLAFANAATAAGAEISEGITVTGLVTRGGRVVAVACDQGKEIEVSGSLFLLANSGVPALVSPWINLPTWNLPFQVLLSHPLPDNPVRHLVGHASRTLSLKREKDGRLMISGGRPGHWDHEADKGIAIPQEVAANIADAVAVYPSLEGLEVDIADAGHLEADSVDAIPIIDRLPGIKNVLYATGWSGHGWAIAPAITKLITAWALEDARPQLLAPFSFGRFG